MKLSADHTHPDYHPQANQAKVFLEGSERKNVIFADEEGRHAILYKLNEFGLYQFKDGEAVTEHFWGHVRIEIPPGFIDPGCLKTYTISVEPTFNQKAADSSADPYILMDADGVLIEADGITWFVSGDED